MSIQAGLLGLIEYSRRVEQEFLADLPDDERHALGTVAAWAAKDIIAHLAEWRRRGAEQLHAAQRGEPLGEVEEFDPINLQIFQTHHRLTWEQVLEISERTWRSFFEAIRDTPEDLLRSTNRSESKRPIWRRLTVDAANHPVLHLSEHARAHGRADSAVRWMEGLAPKLLDLDPSDEWHGVVHYNLACHFALTGRAQKALASLETALRLRPDLREWSAQDPDLESLHGLPAFREVSGAEEASTAR